MQSLRRLDVQVADPVDNRNPSKSKLLSEVHYLHMYWIPCKEDFYRLAEEECASLKSIGEDVVF
jgi:hypothetical protein